MGRVVDRRRHVDGKCDNGRCTVEFGDIRGSKFVAVAKAIGGDCTSASGTNCVITSSDGLTWAAASAISGEEWNSVTYGGPSGSELFVSVAGAGSNRVMTSQDGTLVSCGIRCRDQLLAIDHVWRESIRGRRIRWRRDDLCRRIDLDAADEWQQFAVERSRGRTAVRRGWPVIRETRSCRRSSTPLPPSRV